MVIIKDLLHGQLIDFELDCPIIQHTVLVSFSLMK